jgi:hypothetical protein
VLGGGGVGIYFLTKSDNKGSAGGSVDTNDPQAVAQQFAGAFEKVVNSDLWGFNSDDFRSIVCGKDFDRISKDTEHTIKTRQSNGRKPTGRPEPDQVKAGASDVKVNGDHGTFNLTQVQNDGKKLKDRPLTLEHGSGNWQVCGLYADEQNRSTTLRPPTTR